MNAARIALISLAVLPVAGGGVTAVHRAADLRPGRPSVDTSGVPSVPDTVGERRPGRTAGVAVAAPEYREVRVPAGTVLRVVLQSSVASDTSNVEDRVRGRVRDSVRIGGMTAIPAGSTVSGIVTQSVRSGRVKGRARLAMRFTTLNARRESYRIRTATWAAQAPGTKKKDAGKVAVPAAGGAVIGAIAGGRKGAAIGAAVGGGAGAGVVLATRGEEVRLAAGRVLLIRLTQPLTVRVPAGR